jgi:uncharacterized protein (TIGR03067 family)
VGGAGFQIALTDPPFLWKINKETIETGTGKKDAPPPYRYTYRLNPENQEGAIDLIQLDNEKDKKMKDKQEAQLGIYFVKGDYLMISFGPSDVRPKDFTTSNDNRNWLRILRRVDRKE